MTAESQSRSLPDVNRSIGRYSGYVYAIMRIMVGLLFACHGAQKLLGWFPNPKRPPQPLDAMGAISGSIELVGGLLVAVGLFTMIAAFLCSGLMAVAYFMVHFQGGFFPIQNGGEPAVLYCFVFLYIFFRGGGLLSLDSMIWPDREVAPGEVGGPMRTGQRL